jgi:hypothetical protein
VLPYPRQPLRRDLRAVIEVWEPPRLRNFACPVAAAPPLLLLLLLMLLREQLCYRKLQTRRRCPRQELLLLRLLR